MNSRPARKRIIGMIHLPPLPGTPFHQTGTFRDIVDAAVRAATILHENDVDGCLVQTADRVYGVGDDCDPARLAAITMIVNGIAKETGPEFQIGVQIMRNALSASLAVAKVAGGSFIRASALIGRTVSPQGLVTPDPLALMTYREKISAWDVQVIADIHSMHYRWHGEARAIGDIARLAVQSGADALCLGEPDEASTLALIDGVRARVQTAPIFLAGYTNIANIARMLAAADGVFVGAALEREGWGGVIDPELVRRYVVTARGGGAT